MPFGKSCSRCYCLALSLSLSIELKKHSKDFVLPPHHKHDNFKEAILWVKRTTFFTPSSLTCLKCGTSFCIVVLIRSIWVSHHAEQYFSLTSQHDKLLFTLYTPPLSLSLSAFDASAMHKPEALWLITETRVL